MNEIAKEMNEQLKAKSEIFYDFLSDFGKNIFMPKGIIVQSAEAKQKATKYNATIGIAREKNGPMYLSSLYSYFNKLKPSQIFDYAPGFGVQDLRVKWKEKIIKDNPLVNDPSKISTPVVTSGLTQGISLLGDLFVNKDDEIIIPDKLWENYNLIFEERYNAKIVNFPLFDSKLYGFDTKSLDKALQHSKNNKIILLLNFPNNPTGYTPTVDEVQEIVRIIKSYADKGKKILVAVDDAYYGLLYEENLLKGSIFFEFVGIHPNIVAVKIDGFSKEDYAWGLRIGFITFADYNHNQEAYKILESKVAACIRCSISNCSLPAQSMFLDILGNSEYIKQKEEKFQILKNRYNIVKKIVYKNDFSDLWDVYPFNSGYFMCIKPKVDAEKLRTYLLDKYQIGTIALGDDLRIAFSSVEDYQLEDLFLTIAKAIKELK